MDIWKVIKDFFSKEENFSRERIAKKEDSFARQARKQFLRLQKKGLGIPIATL